MASPSPAEANEDFEARTLNVSAIARHVAAGIRRGDLDKLRQHIPLENAARDNDNGVDQVRLSAEFHVKLARASENTFL